jgi:SNF2 family DNA or RNA helicase
LGKTIQTISLLLYIQERKHDCGPHLIVAPKSCLSNWEAEFKRFAPNFNVHILVGDQETRDAELNAMRKTMSEGKAVACVTNYEQVYRNEFLMKTNWHLVIVDEGHRLKNPETVLHTAMAQLRCRMRLLLTGTPLQNSLNELWALLHYLLPDLFTCLMDFKAWFSQPFKGSELNEFDMQLDPEQEHQVIAQMHSLLAPFLLQRLKSEVLADKLPPRSEVLVRVPLSAWQKAAYTDLEKRTIKLLGEDDSISSEQVNNALMQLRKISLHPYLFQQSYSLDENLFRTSGKVEALDRILPKLIRFDHKVLIFSQFTSVLDILEAYLKWKRIAFVRLDGQVPHDQRRERMERFNADPKLSVFLLSARAGGLGLNLQSADTVVLFDLDWNPQNDKQAIARVHRVGQKREVRVVRLVTDSAVERHMEQRCAEKLEMEQKIMGAGMFRRQATADMRRQALRLMLGLGEDGVPLKTLQEESRAESSDLTTPEELNRQLARSAEEKKAFEEMDVVLLKPRRGAAKEISPLERAGRLMTTSEVPDGFTGLRADDD